MNGHGNEIFTLNEKAIEDGKKVLHIITTYAFNKWIDMHLMVIFKGFQNKNKNTYLLNCTFNTTTFCQWSDVLNWTTNYIVSYDVSYFNTSFTINKNIFIY